MKVNRKAGLHRHWAWLLPLVSLAWHGVVALALRWICLSSYGEGAWVPEEWVCSLTFVILAAGAGVAVAAAVLGLWKLFQGWGLLWCALFAGFLFLPSVLVSCLWLYALMFFLGWA